MPNTAPFVAALPEPKSGEVSLPPRDVRAFFRGLIEWRVANGMNASPKQLELIQAKIKHVSDPPASSQLNRRHEVHIFKAAFYEAYIILRSKNIDFKPFDPDRQERFISRAGQELRDHEADVLRKAFERVWFQDIPAREIRKIEAQLGPPEYAGMDPAIAAKLLGLRRAKGSQEFLENFGGDYFIFRRLPHEGRLVVGYMNITLDKDLRYPGKFVTLSQPSAGSRENHDPVEGICYHAPDRQNAIFTLGRYRNSSQIRSAILEPTLKPGLPHPERAPRDLVGIRLGLGRPDREIIGYRIWCSRLIKKAPPKGWHAYAREYHLVADKRPALKDDEEFRQFFGTHPDVFFLRHVVGFRHILRWLDNQHVAIVHRDGDP